MELKYLIGDAVHIEKQLKELCYYSNAHSMRQIIRYLEQQLPKENSSSREVLEALLKGGR